MDKRQNITLLFFGIFLIVTNVSQDNTILSKVALGATISGVFLVISDCYLGMGTRGKTLIDLIHRQGRNILSDISEKDMENYRESIKNSDGKIKQEVEAATNFLNRVILVGNVCFGLGVFSFLLVLGFYDESNPIFNGIKKIESRLTIISFSIIMINYWLQNYLEEKYKMMLKYEEREHGQTEI